MQTNTIAILHLSDFHLKTSSNPISTRTNAIAAAVRAECSQLRACAIAITGDIAFSGLREEYDQALAFLESLRTALQTDHPHASIIFAAVPGNHDCDLSGPSELRELTIANIEPKLDSLSPDGELATMCLGAQKTFFAFLKDLSGTPLPVSDWIYHETELAIDAFKIRFQCHNSAWLSQLHDEPGRLLFPVSIASVKDSPSRDVTAAISLVHHPFNWYTPTNSRTFQEFIERTSDLVLTGHEHIASGYRRESHVGTNVDYLEGAVLQETQDPHDSGFHIVLLDLPARQYLQTTYKWTADGYAPIRRHDWIPFKRNPLLAQHAFDNNEAYLRFLTDPGTPFTHPRRQTLALADLFVYPDLSRRSFVQAKQEDPAKSRIRSSEVLDFLADKGQLVITGAANSGKTSLAKVLYSELKRRKGVVPILLKGSDIRGARARDFPRLCASAFSTQYSERQLTRYQQLERSQRLLLIDDFDDARLTVRGQKELITAATTYAASVIVLADDVFMIDLLSHGSESARDAFKDFHVCTIREFGYALRGRLVDKWHRLGYEISAPESDLQHTIDGCERMLNTLIGRNLVPSFPLTILTLLQTMEAATTPSTAAGSYGYLYEALITAALARVSNRAADLDTKYTYLSRVAYALYDADIPRLNRQQLDEITDEYFSKYRIKFPLEQMLRELAEARLLEEAGGYYSFKYKYVYCYFVARYLRDNIAGTSSATRHVLRQMAERVHFEDHANILTFYIYLTRDPELIGHLLECAKRIYRDRKPCDFERDVQFVNALYTDSKPLLLPPGDPSDHRELERERLDATEEDISLQGNAKDLAYGDELVDLLKMNFAFKTLHVLGQVIRNFPGSLERDVKRDIAKECYLLGLRTLSAILGIAEANLDELRTYFARLIREHRSITRLAELAESTDEMLIWLTLGCAFGIVKRVSAAVGLQELSGTYADVLEALGPILPARLIDVSIRLDHFDAVPVTQIEGVARDVTGNHFSRRVLRDLVANHFYLFQVDYRSRQTLGELLEIRATEPKYLDNPTKKER